MSEPRLYRDGYVRRWVAGRGRVLEHRLVMEQTLGRPLAPGEEVHHRNGVKHDNRPENLELHSDRTSHARAHSSVPRDEIVDLYKRGFGNGTVAARVGVSPATVTRVVTESGVGRSRSEAQRARHWESRSDRR